MNIDRNLNRETQDAEEFPPRMVGRHRHRCQHCGGSMREGFLIEHQSGFAPAAPTLWQSGPIGESFWTGVEVKPAEQRRVVAHRCERCGAIALFAL